MRGVHAVFSPAFGAPAMPAAWQTVQPALNTLSPLAAVAGFAGAATGMTIATMGAVTFATAAGAVAVAVPIAVGGAASTGRVTSGPICWGTPSRGIAGLTAS